MDYQPIVTISVTAYNSSRYIRETLESIKAQTYKNIILQIADDCSTDNTVDICKRWIEENKDRFVKTKIITSEKNTGVSTNCNREWDACETDWFKGIAGDDILLPNCIEDNVNYVLEHPDTVVVFSKLVPFSIEKGIKVRKKPIHNYSFFSFSREKQYRCLFEYGNVLPAPSAFYNMKKIKQLNYKHDIRIPLLEDYPKWISLIRLGIEFHFFEKETVEYRFNDNSLSIGLLSPRYYESNILFYLYYYLDEVGRLGDRDYIFKLIAEKETMLYSNAYNEVISLRKKLYEIENSTIYKILFSPLKKCKSIIKRLF